MAGERQQALSLATLSPLLLRDSARPYAAPDRALKFVFGGAAVDAHAGELVGVAVGSDWAAAFFPASEIAGVARGRGDAGVPGAGWVGNLADRGGELRFDGQFRHRQLVVQPRIVQRRQIVVMDGVRLKAAAIGHHRPRVLPAHMRGIADHRCDEEYGRREAMRAEDREGLGKIIAIPIIHGDHHRAFRQGTMFAQRRHQRLGGQHGETMRDQVLHLLREDIRRHR